MGMNTIETDCMGDLLVAEALGEAKHADHDQSSHGRRYGDLPMDEWARMDWREFASAKVSDLMERTGLDKDFVWPGTLAWEDSVFEPEARWLEEAAHRVLDLPGEPRGALARDGEDPEPEKREALARAIYDSTQEWFAENDVTHVRLHRGVSRATADQHPLTSWATDRTSAEMFAEGETGTWTTGGSFDRVRGGEFDTPGGSRIVTREIPVEHIFSIPVTGPAKPSEGEVLVLSTAFSPETKHAGPGGALVHSTGTPQDAHGGSFIEDPTARARRAIFEGVTKEIDIAETVEYVTGVLQDAIDSGELGTEPQKKFGGGGGEPRSAKQMFEDMRDAVPLYAEAAALEAGRDPDDPVHKGMGIESLKQIRDSIAKQIEDKQFRSGMLMNVLSSPDRVDRTRNSIRESRAAGVEPVDALRQVRKDRQRYSEDFKKEVQAQVVDQWKEDLVTADEAVKALNALGLRPPLVNDPGDPDDEVLADAARTLVATWAHTSNDRNPVALAVQEIANRHFKVEDAMEWHEPSPEWDDDTEWVVRSALQGMHDRTQEWFAERGIEKVTLHRGQKEYALVMDERDPELDHHVFGQDAPGAGFDYVRQRPLSSWSLSSQVADGFAAPSGSMMTAEVPVSKILSMPRTGFGCTNEEECVILGGVMDVEWTFEGGGD